MIQELVNPMTNTYNLNFDVCSNVEGFDVGCFNELDLRCLGAVPAYYCQVERRNFVKDGF